jgi:hypothetical protein
MSMSDSFEALRRANPRAEPGFARSADAVANAVRARVATAIASDVRRSWSPSPRRLARIPVVGAAFAVAAAVAVSLTVGFPGGESGLENARAAMRKAATLTAASAEVSGTAVVRITHNGELWARRTARWNRDDLALSGDAPRRAGRTGSELRVVNGTLYGIDPRDGRWVDEGSPENIDPGSGTTPAEYLAAVREDVGGATLRRITRAMTGLTTRQLDDGSTIFSGTVAAGLVARETGFKEGRQIRVLPFGYVAHGEAEDPAAPLDAAVTVGADGIVREIAVSWGPSASAWRYTVTYSALGATPAPVAPANAKSLLKERLRGGK